MNTAIQTPPTIRPMPDETYHALCPHVSQSMLKDFAERRRLYEGYYVTKTMRRPFATDAMELGTIIHTACLEPHRNTVVEIPAALLSKNGATGNNACREWMDEQRALGLIPMKASEIDIVRRAKESFLRAAKDLLALRNAKVYVEHAVTWTDVETDLPLKARPDWIVERNSTAYVLDLKTCGDASPSGFAKSCANFGYGIQRAHYLSGVRAALRKPCEFYFVAVETCAPFAAAVYHATGEAFERFDDKRHAFLRELANCLASGDFREPWEGVVNEIELPKWA